MRLRRVTWNPWQSNGKLRNMKNQSFEVLCHKQIRNARRESKEKSAMKHFLWQSCQPFWSTSWSPIYAFYMSFQSLGSQKSNASNGAQFGAEMKELQPLQADHSKLKEEFCIMLRNHPFVAKWFRSHFAQCCGIPPEVSRYFLTRWKPNTTSWKTTSQRCEVNRLLRSNFAALCVHLRNLVDLGCTCEMVPSASRYLRPTLGDIFHQIFVV